MAGKLKHKKRSCRSHRNGLDNQTMAMFRRNAPTKNDSVVTSIGQAMSSALRPLVKKGD